MFGELKENIKNIIQKNRGKEIDNYSNNKNIGIYMIYIDNFDDDKIIPIYIGQTGCGKNRNFQNRYKEHLQEVMALNRLKYDYYKSLLLDNFYDGHYKTCKIFQYMVDHNCTLNDFHMIVLEEIDTENNNLQEMLDQKEQEYFARYLPAFFGFNQINTVAEGNKEIFQNIKEKGIFVESDKLLNYKLQDCENFIKYFGYGYTKFNYYHCFPKSHHIIAENDKDISYKIKEEMNLLKERYYNENKFKKYRDELPEIEIQRENVLKDIENFKSKFEQIYSIQIKEYCKDNKIGMMQKYNDIIRMLLYQNKDCINDFEKYLKRKKINVNILDILNKNDKFIDLRNKYLRSKKILDDLNNKIYDYKHIKRTDDLLRILPQKVYDVLPLRDRYCEIKFDDLENNSAVINFEFSNYGIDNDWWTFTYNLIKIDYKINVNNKIKEKKNIFIKPKEYDEDYKIDYFEKDAKELKIHKNAFCVKNFPDYISTTMEVQNGINEYTLMDKEKFDLKTILDEINLLINEQTKVKIEVRNRMKNKCKEFIKYSYTSENLLKNKILESK